MRKEKESTILGKRLRVTQLGFEDGMDLLVLLGKTLGPSIGAMLAGVEKKAGAENLGDANVSLPAVANGLADLASRLNTADLKHVVSALARSTRINRDGSGEKWPQLEPEVDLAGDYAFMFRWLGFALEVNFGDFLGEGGLIQKLSDTTATMSPASTMSA
jgi:hypothetical protein